MDAAAAESAFLGDLGLPGVAMEVLQAPPPPPAPPPLADSLAAGAAGHVPFGGRTGGWMTCDNIIDGKLLLLWQTMVG